MADKKKNTPLDVPKVKRGVKEALTPGKKPEKEETPIEKVIGRELTKIVEKINFDAKFESIKVAIESKQSETLLPILEKINGKLNPILGALYGISNINESTNPDSLLSRLGNLDPKLTTFGPLDFKLGAIYDLLVSEIKSKSSYKLEDLAIAVSAEIQKILKNIDNRDVLESLSKTLEEMKSSVLSNSSAENINRIYKQLEVISNFVSSNKHIDYSVAISDVATKISNIASLLSSNDSSDKVDNSGSLKTLSEMSSTLKSMYELASNNIEQSTTMLREISGKLDSIHSETFIVDNKNVADKLEDIKKILVDYASNSNNLNDSSKGVSTIDTNYDSIISSITDNTNDIIDIISEKITDIVDPIKRLVNTDDFNLRTAQIIDAINSLSSSKDVNTQALKYNVNIEASGLDKDTVEALIDLSNISLDSNEYLKNLNSILSSLSNFETLNDIKLNNKNIKNIVDSINALSKMNLGEDTFDPFSVDCLKYFIDTLGSIKLSDLNQFDEDSLKSISIITDTLSSFANLKLKNFNETIKSLNVDEFVKLLNTLKDIPVYDKEDKTTMTAISDLFSAISSISGFDNKKFEDLSSNLRKIIRLTEKPTAFTKLKISDRGLIHILMHNIGEIAAETKETFDNTKNIGKMLNLISSISQYDTKSFDNLKYISYILAVITSKDEPYLYKAFNNIEEIGDFISGWDVKNSPASLIGNQLKLINNLSSKISLKNISLLAIKSTIALGAMYSLSNLFNNLGEILKSSENVEKNIKTLNNALVVINSIESINIDNIVNLNESLKILISSFNHLEKFANIDFKEVDVSNNITALQSVFNGINSMKNINIDNIENLNESLNILISSFVYLKKLTRISSKEIDISDNINVLNYIAANVNSIEKIKDINNIENLNESLSILISSFVYLKKLARISSKETDISNSVTALQSVVDGVNSMKNINIDNIENLNESLKILISSFAYLKMLELISSKEIDISNSVTALQSVVSGVNSIENINIDNIENLSESLKILISSFAYLKMLALISSKEIDISNSINVLNNIVANVNNIKKIKNINNIENINESLKILISSFKHLKKFTDIPYEETDISNNIESLQSVVGGVNSIENINIDNIKNINESLSILMLSFKYLKKLADITCEEANISNNITALQSVVDGVNSTKTINIEHVENLNEGLKGLILPFIYLKILALMSSKEIDISNNITALQCIVNGVNSTKTINVEHIENLNEGLKTLMVSSIYLRILAFLSSKEIDISNNIAALQSVVDGVNSIKTINIDNIENLNKSIKALISSSIYLTILALIPSKAIDISKNIEVLNNVAEQLRGIEAVKNVDSIESLTDSIKCILKLNIWLAIVSITMPLAFIGAFVIDKEISMLSKIVGKLNELEPVKEDAVKNLNSLAIVIVAASGLLLLGAFVGGYVLDNFFEIIGFTTTLSLFIFLTIGAFNLATKGMQEAKLNADEFTMLLIVSSGIMLLGGAIMTLYWPLVLGSLGFSVALGAFILMTIGAYKIASKGLDSSIKTAEDLVILVGIAAGVMLIGGTLFALYPWLMATTLLFGVYLTAFVVGVTFLFNWAGGLVDDATSGAQKFAILVGVATVSLLLGGFLFMVYPWMTLTTLLFGVYLTAFVVGVTFLFNTIGGSLDEAVSSADKFAILVGVSALALCLGGFLFQKYPWMMLTTLLFGVYLAAFVGAVVFTFGFASKFIERAEIDALNLAKVIGISAAAMLIGGLFMLIPGMPLAVLEFTGIFILFLGATLLAYTIASKHIKEAKQTAIGFGVVVLLTSIALLVGGGLFLYFPGLDMECLKFAGISTLFIAIFGVAIWLLGKIKKKDLIQGELALAGIAVLIGGFGYAFTFVAEAMDMISKVNDPWGQLLIMGTIFGAMIALVAGVTAIIAFTGVGGPAIAAAEGIIAGVIGIIWLLGKAMSAIAQSMADLDKVKDLDFDKVEEAISGYVSLPGSLMPLANPAILVSMLAVKASVWAMSEAILAIATSVKAVCDLKTEDGRQLTSQDFTLAAENIKSVVTILGRSLIEVYDGNEEMFSSGSTIGDLLGADSKFSRVAKSCATMGQLITDISAGVKDFADLKMPIYDENGKIKGYRSMNDKDFETAGKSIAQVVTTIGTALIGVYDGHAEMFEWKLIGDNPFAMVSKSCLTMGKLITNISAGVKDFAELRMPMYDENTGQIKGYREMDFKDFIKAGLNIGIVLTCIATAIKGVYDDPKNKYMFTDPSTWHTSADKTPFGMVVKAMTGVGTLIKDSASAIKEIAEMQLDFTGLEGADGKVARIVSVLAASVRSVYDNNKEIFTDDSFWHEDPQKTPFGMVTQCLNNVIPLVKNTVATVDDIAKMKFTGNDLTKGGKLYAKINSIIGVIPKAVIDIIRDKTYGEYLKDSDYFEIYENMKTSYSKFSDVIEEIIGSYDSINKIEYDDKKINSMKHTVKLMILSLCNVITDPDILNILESEIFKNNKKSDKNKLSVIASAFEEFNEIIEEVSTAYDSINKSLSSLGVNDNDTTVITTITSNLNTMISKLSESITLNTISLDAEKVNSFSANVSSFYSSIETLTRAYKLIPDDLSNYDNVVKAMGGINSKISETPNLDSFNAEQKALENYVITLNNLDLTKVQTLSNLMSVMNELATKLGSLDKFTNVLNNKISATLNNLASQIKTSGDIINKADELQKKRHEAIKASIKEIQDIMDKKLIVEVNHNEIQSTTGDYPEQPIGQNSTPSFLERAGNALGGLFGFNNEDSQNSNGANVSHVSNNTQPLGSVGGIDYDRLKRAIMQAIMEASPSPK